MFEMLYNTFVFNPIVPVIVYVFSGESNVTFGVDVYFDPAAVTWTLTTDPDTTATADAGVVGADGAGTFNPAAVIWFIVPVLDVAGTSFTNEFVPDPLSVNVIGFVPAVASEAFA